MAKRKKPTQKAEAASSVQKEVKDNTPTNEDLIASIDAVIEISNKIMEKDRSRVLRLKNLVGKLNDAKRLVV